MNVLGVDQSLTSTGLVMFKNNKLYQGNIHLIKTDKDFGDQYERVLYICQEFGRFIENEAPDKIVVEGMAFGAKGTSVRVLAAVQFGIIIEAIRCGYQLNENIFIVTPNQVKKLATGKGNASKDEVYDAIPTSDQTKLLKVARKTTGLYDLADAYWIGKSKTLEDK